MPADEEAIWEPAPDTEPDMASEEKEDPNNLIIDLDAKDVDSIIIQEASDPDLEKEAEKPETQEQKHASAQKRINKAVGAQRAAERRADEAERRVQEVEGRIGNLEQGTSDSQIREFQEKYSLLKGALKKSIEEGDTEKQVELMDSLADARLVARQIQTRQNQPPQQPAQAPPPEQGPPPPEKAMEWWSRNSWYNTEGYEDQSLVARTIDRQIELDGYDKNDDGYYEELDKRLQSAVPGLYTKQVKPKSGVSSVSSPVAPVTPSASGPKQGGRVRLDKEYLDQARELGIEGPEELKEYPANIAAHEREQN